MGEKIENTAERIKLKVSGFYEWAVLECGAVEWEEGRQYGQIMGRVAQDIRGS